MKQRARTRTKTVLICKSVLKTFVDPFIRREAVETTFRWSMLRVFHVTAVLCLFLWQVEGRCHLEPSNPKSKVRWDLGSQKCVPAVCNGANLLTIPQTSGFLPAQLACKMDLIDSARARKCLADKYVVMLGDSTMSETMHDLVMLLSGVAVNDKAMKEYMANGTRQGSDQHSAIWVPIDGQPASHIVKASFDHNHRNMTIDVEVLKVRIRFRFIGNYQLGSDDQGIETLIDPQFQPELSCLLGEPSGGCGTRRPDMLVINSGLHDARTPTQHHIEHLGKAADKLREIADKGTKVFWKATNMAPFSKGMNALARFVMEERRIVFIDTQDIFYYFKEDIAAACCNDHQGKGFHFGAIAHYTNSTLRVTVSSMVTQRILDHMCKTEHNTQ